MQQNSQYKTLIIFFIFILVFFLSSCSDGFIIEINETSSNATYNLSDYYTKAQVNLNFSTQWTVNTNTFQSKINNFSSYYTKTQSDNIFQIKINNFSSYPTKSQVTSGYVNLTNQASCTAGSAFTGYSQANKNFTCTAVGGSSGYVNNAAGWTNTSTKTTTSLNVGIGTTLPNRMLDVRGDVYINETSPTLTLYDSDSGSVSSFHSMEFRNNTNGISMLLTQNSGDVALYNYNRRSDISDIIIHSYGGIGGDIEIGSAVYPNTINTYGTVNTYGIINSSSSVYSRQGGQIIFDEFTYWTTARTNGAGICAALSSGTAAAAGTTTVYIGAVQFLDSTTANGGYQCRSDAAMMYFLGGETFEARFSLVDRATNVHQLGFQDSSTAANSTDGCWLQIDRLTAKGHCRNNAGLTSTGTTYAMSAATYYILEIEALSSSSVKFTIYNAAKTSVLWTSTVGSNVPNTSARAFGARIASWEKTTDAAAIMAYYDYVKVYDKSYT